MLPKLSAETRVYNFFFFFLWYPWVVCFVGFWDGMDIPRLIPFLAPFTVCCKSIVGLWGIEDTVIPLSLPSRAHGRVTVGTCCVCLGQGLVGNHANDVASWCWFQRPVPGSPFPLYISTLGFFDLNFHEGKRNAYILITSRGHFGWQETLAVFKPLVISKYGKESVVLCSGPVTLFSTKGFPLTAKSLTSPDAPAVPFVCLWLTLFLFFNDFLFSYQRIFATT